MNEEVMATTSKAMKRARDDYLKDSAPTKPKSPFKFPKIREFKVERVKKNGDNYSLPAFANISHIMVGVSLARLEFDNFPKKISSFF